MTTVFRNNQGTLILSGLFIESGRPEFAIYSVGHQDKTLNGKTYPSLYQLYIQMSDVTEYVFATTYFETYQHWAQLCETEFFKDHIKEWRKELELKVKSEALIEIIEQSQSVDPRKRLEAAKYLYEKVYIKDSRRGRPSKDEIKKEAMKQAKEKKLIDEHWTILEDRLNQGKSVN